MIDLNAQIERYTNLLVNDRSIPTATLEMIDLHLRKPWIPDYVLPIIRAVSPASRSYLDIEILDGWHLPSKKWWLAHAQASHPPDGSGCDVAVHVDFLSSAPGAMHEFDYAALLTSWIHVFGPRDFEIECAWWHQYWRQYSTQ